jgi:hypothetical protein
MKGLQGGQAMMRVACCAGLLNGLEDFEARLKMREGRLRGKVEEEVVLAVAEVMDLYSSGRGSTDWEDEFHKDTDGKGLFSFLFMSFSCSDVLFEFSGCYWAGFHSGVPGFAFGFCAEIDCAASFRECRVRVFIAFVLNHGNSFSFNLCYRP